MPSCARKEVQKRVSNGIHDFCSAVDCVCTHRSKTGTLPSWNEKRPRRARAQRAEDDDDELDALQNELQ